MTAIYLDYNATTPCDSRVLQAMLPYFNEIYGNPANGLHLLGRKAARAVETAREQVAGLLGANSGEILFTSGATESKCTADLWSASPGGAWRYNEHRAKSSRLRQISKNNTIKARRPPDFPNPPVPRLWQ